MRSSRPEVFLEKGVLKICSKFTGKDPCRSVISIKLLKHKTVVFFCNNDIKIHRQLTQRPTTNRNVQS